MSELPELTTQRLLLRPWCKEDLPTFADMNSDPRVMEYLPKLLTHEESNAMVERIQAHFCKHGFGLWAVEAVGVASFIGFVGLQVVPFEAHFTPNIEVGWRLARQYWGQGYATEAARSALAFGFHQLELLEIVAMTTPNNMRSQQVMERLGMYRSELDDFDHPKLPQGHSMRRLVLYRLKQSGNSGQIADP
jgi:RimJ/RimL family protein N-acetyltransferase